MKRNPDHEAMCGHLEDEMVCEDARRNLDAKEMPEMRGHFDEVHRAAIAGHLAQLCWMNPDRAVRWLANQSDFIKSAAPAANAIISHAVRATYPPIIQPRTKSTE